MALSIFQQILAELFIVIYMFSVGLIAPRGAVINSLKREKITLKALILNFLIIPAFGMILIYLFNLPMDIKIGLMLLIISPGGLFSLNFVRISNANIHLAIALLSLFTILSIVITPMVASIYLGISQIFLTIYLILRLFILMVVPLYLGRYLARFIPNRQSISAILGLLSILIFLGFNLLTASTKSNALHTIGVNGISIIVMFVLASWIFGWLLAGEKLENKKVLAISTSMRNVAFCYPYALNEFAQSNVIVAIIAFSAISIVMNMGFALILNIKQKRADYGFYK